MFSKDNNWQRLNGCAMVRHSGKKFCFCSKTQKAVSYLEEHFKIENVVFVISLAPFLSSFGLQEICLDNLRLTICDTL